MRDLLVVLAGMTLGLGVAGCDAASLIGSIGGTDSVQADSAGSSTQARLAAASGVDLDRSRAGDSSEPRADASSAERVDDGESDPSGTSPEDSDDSASSTSSSTYYQWVDERGSVHFASSLEEVPSTWRGRAGRIELAGAAFNRTGSTSAKPAALRPVAEPEPLLGRSHDVTVYTAPWCGWCRKTMDFLDEQGVDYVNKDIESDPEYEAELRAKIGRTSIPLVEIDGRQIRGFDPAAMMAMLVE